jgi:hypothetical protein
VGCFHLIFNLFVSEAVPGNSIQSLHTPTFRSFARPPRFARKLQKEEEYVSIIIIEQTTPLERTNERTNRSAKRKDAEWITNTFTSKSQRHPRVVVVVVDVPPGVLRYRIPNDIVRAMEHE